MDRIARAVRRARHRPRHVIEEWGIQLATRFQIKLIVRRGIGLHLGRTCIVG